jgi:hypothetical protein
VRLVTLLLGVLAVGAVALVFSVYDYAHQGSSTPASRLAPSTTAITPIASPPPPASGPGSPAPTPLIAGLPDGTGLGTGPVAVAAQSEAPAPSQQQDVTAPPATRDNQAKHHGRGHGKHDHPGGD